MKFVPLVLSALSCSCLNFRICVEFLLGRLFFPKQCGRVWVVARMPVKTARIASSRIVERGFVMLMVLSKLSVGLFTVGRELDFVLAHMFPFGPQKPSRMDDLFFHSDKEALCHDWKCICDDMQLVCRELKKGAENYVH